MKVAYMGLIRNTLSAPEEEVALPAGARVRDLLSLLQERHGTDFQNSLFKSNGELRSLARIYIGEKDIDELDGMDTVVEPDRGVYILLLTHSLGGG